MRSEAAANLLALIESSEGLIWSVDLDFRLLIFNQALRQSMYEMFGVQIAVGMSPADLLPPETAERWSNFYRRALSEGSYQIEYPTADGRTLRLSFSQIHSDGAATGISVFGRDISERKAAENSLRLLASIVESTEDGIATYARDGTILTWNRGAEAIFGYSADEAVGKNLSMIVPEERRAGVLEYTEQIVRGDAVRLRGGVGLRKDGKRIRISVSSSPLRDAAGNVNSISIIVRDVTSQHEAEEAQALLASLVEYSDDVIHGIDLDGKITTWSRAAEAFYGYSSQEVLGKSIAMLAMPERQEKVAEILKNIRSGRAIRTHDTVVRHKHGYAIDVDLSISPVRDQAGKPTGASGILRDIRQRKRMERALVESERRYRHAFEKNTSVMLLVDQDDKRIAFANPAAAEFYGFSQEMLVGMPIGQLNGLSDEEVLVDAGKAAREEQGFFVRRHRLASGEERDVEVYCSPIEMPRRSMLLSIIHDVTERKQAEAALRESEERFHATFDQAAVGIVHTAFDGRVLRANRRFAEILGYPQEEIAALNFQQITLPEDLDESLDLLAALVNGDLPTACWEKRYLRKDGSITWVRLTASVQCDTEGRRLHFITVVEDINALKAAQEKIRELAFHDSLTGLPNRRLFLDRLEHNLALSKRRGGNSALFFIDLDNFKALNDALGHAAGDLILRETASRLLAATRLTDTVARIGGDEFVVLLEELSESPEEAYEQARIVAEKILEAIAQPCHFKGNVCHCYASIGGLIVSKSIADVDLAMRLVDDAMYQAKAAGRNAIHFLSVERVPSGASA